MTMPGARPQEGDFATTSRHFRSLESCIVIGVLLFAVAFNLFHLYPDVAIKIPDRNDTGMHLLYTDMAVKAITHGQDFTDPW